jgi:hypothetical protein
LINMVDRAQGWQGLQTAESVAALPLLAQTGASAASSYPTK